MTAGRFQLAALDFDLAEQPRILDRQRGLGCESLEELDHLRIECPRALPIHSQPAEDVVLAQQRYGEQ